ncbi:uncharacterized protein [Triticum aestivum]|uniref:uncharacterized protein n=1 Tax=Triticum aestivum TaxID=4565 RepID=UPI001D034446|nr:uncharacterized protein LOC123131129 [Triticum aestivum]
MMTPPSEKAIWEAFKRKDDVNYEEAIEIQSNGNEVVPTENPEREVTRFLFVEMNEELGKTGEEISTIETKFHATSDGTEHNVEDGEDEVYLPDDIMPTYEEEGVMFDHRDRNTSKKQKIWGPVQPARKSTRVKGKLPIMEKAELLKMKKDLELPKTSVKGLAENKSLLRRLDEASQLTTGGIDKTIQGSSAGEIEIAARTGTVLRCQETLERLS